MQNVSFRSMDEFFEFLPEDEYNIVQFLRCIVFECIPHAKEKLSFNVPYYTINRNICFIWPSSVFWGKKKSYEGVRFGFAKGYLLDDETSYLDKGSRKQIYWRDFKSIHEIDVELLKSYIFAAVLIDEQSAIIKGIKTHSQEKIHIS
ncbi:MAG: DUF1801 domain-containing protein [Ignavibacteriae bacterium]|nr:DUF1801 domain-containing protein [Ignavibacteriota bacterium]